MSNEKPPLLQTETVSAHPRGDAYKYMIYCIIPGSTRSIENIWLGVIFIPIFKEEDHMAKREKYPRIEKHRIPLFFQGFTALLVDFGNFCKITFFNAFLKDFVIPISQTHALLPAPAVP